MRTRWLILSLCLLCLAGAWFFWPRPANTRTRPSALQKVAVPKALPFTILSTNPVSIAAASVRTNKFAWRLSNTTKPIGELVNDRHAILLANALIDTGSPLNFSIPTHLRSQGDPGAYIVQARGPIDNAFRAMLASAGAEIVSYIPNDAYLVRAQAGVANGLAGNPLTQAVIPYEPYYKIQSSMLTLAVGQMALPDGAALNLGLFGDNAQQTIQEIEKLGGKILAQDRSPFGPVVRVQPSQNWTALATLPGVQIVEPYHPRVHANDLSRATVGVAVDTQVSSNYLGLTGKNVMVEVNDSGIDATHPDFSNGGGSPVRVFGNPANLVDTDGHGTHVAGIIAGDGYESTTVTNASGSIMPTTTGQFRGMAPLANLLSIDWNASDQELQAAAALTNALISNNSWNHGDAAYDLEAASYDAATRDALPGVTGSQPVLFVFSAGNAGNGDDTTDPGSGNADTILSPATAKNVITVGALQEFRNITNVVTTISADGVTNTGTPWQPETSTSYRIAGFSSRGNVGIGTEGTFGRYKPDVVAPGTFIVSTRSSQWDIGTYFYQSPTNFNVQDFSVVVQADSLGAGQFPLVPINTVQVTIQLFPNARSPVPFPDLPIYFGLVGSPTYPYSAINQVSIPPDGGLTISAILSSEAFYGFNFAVSNITSEPINFDIVLDTITTNNPGNYFLVYSNLNQSLGGINPASTGPGPYYRYETGTSMAAADVSGVLALMQDYFTNTLRTTPSPALLKAMLINGARPTGAYDLQVQNKINFEGWGLINLPDSLPPGVTNRADANCSSFFIDQNPTNALATGDSHTFLVTINTNAAALPLRVTLAWTDPPGDPAAAIKLVNNLDLVVTNFDDPANPIIFYGNDIASGSIYNTPEGTNAQNLDSINNVENVFISPLLGANYSITVIGRGVNVNAVTAQTNNAAGVYAPNVVQDFALVISSGNGEVTNVFTVTDNPIVSLPTTDQQITLVTNYNAPLLNQLVGASTPLLGTNTIPLGTNLVWGETNSIITLGMTNQWHFYVVTNTTGFTNAAFITFIPSTLAIPRMGVFADSVGNATRPEADIDLYVTTDPTLMNLNPVAISNCVNGAQVGASSGNSFNGASLGRGGTEFVVDTNSSPSIPGEVYYVGVYSEDREASEYGFIPIFSQQPFSQMNPNGSQSVFGVPLPVNIPDGTPALPGHGYVFGLALYPMQVLQVVVTNTIVHQNFGDLIGTMTHGGQNGMSQTVVLNNHDSLGNPPGPYTQIYDDSGQGNIFGSQPSDGPGSLNTFTGQQGNGVWLLTETDDSLTQIGSVTGFNMLVEPHQDLTKGITIILGPLGWFYEYIDVPPGATNLTIYATNITATGVVDLFVRYGAIPTLTATNEFGPARLTNSGSPGPGNSISIGPPLTPGRYWVGLYNESLVPQTVYIVAKLGMGTAPQATFTSAGQAPILDDAVMTNSIFVTAVQNLSSVEVALRVDHPRVSDLVFHLISPQGTRCLLVENRGGTTTNGMGATLAFTNITPASSSGNGLPSTNVIDTGQTAGTVQISYNFYTVPDEMVVQYQGANIFDSGIVNGSGMFTIAYGPGASTQLTIIMNPTVYAGDGDLWDYTVNSSQARYTYLVLTEDTNKTTTPIKYAVPPFHGILTNLVTTNVVLVTNLVPTAAEWHNSFELGSSANISPTAPQYFPEGWHVDSGSVDLAINGTWFGNKADEGTWLVDLDGSDAGTISTNIPTVPGQNYVLSFAYSRNADSVGVTIPSANVLINNNPVGTLVADFNNTWASLNWHSTSYVFTATSPSTLLTFHSLDAGKPWPAVAYGVLLDAINLTAGLNDDFEKTAAGDYAQGVNPVFGGWTVNANQVTVISNASLAYSGTNLLALADGVISRILPTVPGQTYNLSYAYRGPGAVALWRGESNAVDSISGNNGILTNDISFAAGEVNSAFSMGTNGFVFVPASPSLDVGPGPGFTIDGWVYPQNLSSPHPVVEWSQAGGLSAGMHFYVSSTVGTVPGCLFGGFIEAGNPGVGQAFVSSPNIVAANVLQHVALTYNHQTGNAAMYLNGVMVASTNNVGVVVPWTTGNVLIGRRINTITPSQNFHFAGQEDEISIYRRDLSASEIQAIFQKGSSGKYDTNAPSIATGLAEAQVTVGGTNLLFFGNNTKWRTTNLTFVATQSNTVLQITGIEPGMLLDNFALTQFLVTTNLVVATNLNGSDVYYLPEQSLDTFAGLNANGPWQLEIWDNRAGAGLTNTLVSWQLRFNFATNFSSIGVLTNGLAVTNVIPPGGMEYYLVVVPPNADFATNRLLFATGPLNVWFNQTTLPAGINPPDYLLIPNSTGGSSILSLTSVPTNFAAGGTYYLGVQNLGAATVTYGIEVDFHLLFPPAPPSIGTQIVDELTLLTVTNTASSAHLPLTYSLLNPPAGMTIDTNGVITWTPSEAQGPGFYTIQTIITDSGVPPLSTTNSFNVIVIEVNTPPFFLGTPSNQTINAFSTLIVTNAAGDSDIPANPLTYTLTSTVTGTNVPIIDVNTGIITWTPTLAQVLTTNAITTVVTDYNPWAPVNQHLSATNYFTVFVTGALSPFAFTQPATSVTGTSAQLNGMATPNGPPTTAWFEWGTSAGYGNQTPPASVGGSFNVVYVASPINGLVMNQPYHFRLVVSNVVGVVHGFDQIFDEAGVVAWGGDYLGQTNVPPGLSNVVAVAAAHDHSLALKNDGTVVAWGDGLHGQTNVPAGLNGVVAVAGGEFYSLALKNNGTVAAWGANTILGQTNVPAGLNSVVNIAGGRWSSLALKSNGQVVAWGYNIAGLTNVPAGLSNVVAVAGGGFHSMAVKNDGTVVAWGDNAAGQTDVPPGLSNVVAIAGGGFHSLALKYDGTVVAWGDNSDGQTDVPPGLSNVVAVAAGGFHSLVLKNDGSVLAWGDNSTNQSSIPTGLSNVVAISSGYFHNLALASPFNVNLTNTPPFWLTTNLPPLTMDELTLLTVTNTASDSDLPPQTLTYTVTMLVDTNAMITNGWPLNYATTNPPPVVNNNGVITWTPGEAQGPGVYIITAVVTDNGAPPLSATNSFTVTVNEVNLPPVLTLPPDTNIEEFVAFTAQATATDPDIPPNPLTFALVSGPAGLTVTTNGVITWTPGQPPGPGTYAVTISVTDTNAYALTNQSLSVTNQFNITVTAPSVIIINSITATNIGGTNGFLLQWSGPTNFQYEIQWTTNLLPLIVWHTVLNPVINVVVTSTNGHFSFFDDGTLTGGFGPMKFYRVLGGLNLGPITGSGPANNTVLAGATSQAVVAVPANAISASNVLLSATGPLNVWFNQTNPPTGNTNAGDFLMLSATSAGAFMLTSNSVPPLVPGTNYYLGFQNLGATNLTFVFQVIFGYPPVSISSVSVLTNGNFQLQWSAPTNYQFQVAWTTNLVPPVVWNYIPPSPPYITSVTTNFTFVDTNAPTAMKFYRLVEYP